METHIVYKTTNLVNERFYIGVHKQEGIEFDGYLGSGKALQNAINKYGKKHSEETRNKMSLVKKGKSLSEETKNKMSLAAQNRSEEHKEKISLYSKGKKWCHNPNTLECKTIHKESELPEGFIYGYRLKNNIKVI
jgi:hypothetical protein